MELSKSDFSREQVFLYAKKGQFPKQTQLDMREGKVRFMDADRAHCAEITSAGGTYDLLKSTNDKLVGVSDFDSNKLDAGVNVGVGRIKLAYGTVSSVTYTTLEKQIANASFSSKVADFPTQLLRAKLNVKQDGKVLCSLPVERFTHAVGSTKVQGEEDVLHLSTPIILTEQKPVSIQLEFNSDAGIEAIADTAQLVQVRFMGTETASK